MAENLNDDLVQRVDSSDAKRKLLDFSRSHAGTIAAFLVGIVVCCLLFLLMFPGHNLVTLSERDYVCTKPTATTRFAFDKTETCDQYSRRPGTGRWDK
jgi:hypothetical protein